MRIFALKNALLIFNNHILKVLYEICHSLLIGDPGGTEPQTGMLRIRVTLDHHIVSTEARLDLFALDLNLYPVLGPFQGVLEVKYNGFLLSYIKSAVSQADRSELSVSKYCLARSAGLKFRM